MPTGTITYLFTDVEGSTRLWEQAPEAMGGAMSQHDELIERCVTGNAGSVVRPRGEGDSRFAVFENAVAALTAARDIHEAIARAEWALPGPLRVRIALHTGQAELRAGDYYGTAVNRCARLRAIASGGQTLVSQATYELVRDQVPKRTTITDLGEHRLKDLERAEHIYQLTIAGLASDFPPLHSLDAIPNNLPVQLTSFVGREQELARVKAQLAGTHLLTLTGSGGTGKTRLALQVAAELVETFPDGVWFVDLARLSDPALVPQTVASILGVREQPGRPIESALNDYLHTKTLLLILDNCEHLVEACAQLADGILHASPKVRILATSREALGIAGEVSWPVPSLRVPAVEGATVESLAQSEAVRLLLDRAIAVQPSFQLTAENAAAVAQLCTRLDGIPLALELAASRLRALTVEQLAARLDDRFRLLTGGSRTALPRQQTLRALVDWSYGLLSAPERVLFRRLAVFMGGWTLEAAESVCGGQGTDDSEMRDAETRRHGDTGTGEFSASPLPRVPAALEPDVEILDLQTRLVDKSLVVAKEEERAMRYQMLETIRQYAREKLIESEPVERLRDAHLAFFADWVRRRGDEIATGSRASPFELLDNDYDNVRAALAWALDRDTDRALTMVGSLPHYWVARGLAAEGEKWCEQALERDLLESAAAPDIRKRHLASRASALLALGQLRGARGGLKAIEPLQAAVGLYEELGDPVGLSFSYNLMGIWMSIQGDSKTGRAAFEKAIEVAESASAKGPLAMAHSSLGRWYLEVDGDIPRARANLERAIALAREGGYYWGVGLSLMQTAEIDIREGQYESANARLLESLSALQAEGNRQFMNMAQSAMADVARFQGDHGKAIDLYRQTIKVWKELGQLGGQARCIECLAFIALAQSDAAEGGPQLDRLKLAGRLIGAAAMLREESGTPMTPPEQIEFGEQVEKLRQRLGAEVFQAAWSEGHTLSREQAVRLALAG